MKTMLIEALRWCAWKVIVPKCSSTGSCANRFWYQWMDGEYEVTITVRDTMKPDAHSREELVEMLETIRQEELVMGWKVPEPPLKKTLIEINGKIIPIIGNKVSWDEIVRASGIDTKLPIVTREKDLESNVGIGKAFYAFWRNTSVSIKDGDRFKVEI